MKRASEAWLRFMSPDGALPAGMEPTPPKRERAAPDADLAEAGVMREVRELLQVHPDVLFAVRQNSGAASYEAASGKWAPVKFYEIVRCPEQMTIVDWWGLFKDGRLWAIETKHRRWKMPENPTIREIRQANFICMIQEMGGRAGFATSAEDARRIIEGA